MIPRKIHYFWIGGNPKPDSVLYCIDSWKKFCPYLNTQVLRKHGLENEDRDQMIQNIKIFASDVLCPKSYNTLSLHITERTLSIHHFYGTWQDSRGKRRHKITTGINRLFGEKVGSKINRELGNLEYYIQAVQKKLKH